MDTPKYVYNCTVDRWIDGDTVRLTVDLGFRTFLHEKMRIKNFNAPELTSPDRATQIAAQQSKLFAESLAPPGTSLVVASHRAQSFDRYNRWLAALTLADGGDFATRMVAAGMGIMV